MKRVAELVRHELGQILAAGLHDPRIGFVTITRVEVASDLKAARIFVSILGPEAPQRTALRGLESARARIQTKLGDRLGLRRVPEISFHIDERIKQSIRMSSLLSGLARERAEEQPPRETTEPRAAEGPEETPENGS